MSDNRILIVGAGLGGLALARGLQNANIPFRCFERDPSPTFRPQGYRVRIDPVGGEALKSVLGDEAFEEFERSCAETTGLVAGFENLDALTGERIESNFGQRRNNHPPGSRTWAADRVVFRRFLLKGLQDHVSFGKELEKYETTDSGVKLFFKDGSTEEGAILIAADGLRSPIRRQVLPDLAPVDTDGRCIYGKTFITPESKEKVMPKLLQHGKLIQEKGATSAPLSLFMEPITFAGDHEFHPQNYVYWVLLSDTKVYNTPDDKLLRMSGDEAKQLTLELTKSWDPSIRALFEFQDPSLSSPLRITSQAPSQLAWKSMSRVTFLGDSIHNMSPTGGVGANTALRDAGNLTQILSENGVNSSSIERYEDMMKEYAAEAINKSYSGGKFMYNQRPFEECQKVEF